MKRTADILRETKAASPALAWADGETKNRALYAMADRLISEKDSLLRANEEDVAAAKERLGDVMTDRLRLTEARIRSMADGIRTAAALPDPVGVVLEKTERPNGLLIEKVSVPMGVIGIIYESRPNVTSDAAALAVKAGSAAVLRGGREAFRSNEAIVRAIRMGLSDAGLDPALIGFVEDTDRASSREMMEAAGLIDLLIPRGGAGLIRACVENAKVPCIQTGVGICTVYVDAEADQDMALSIVENAKTSRPSVCNAEEVLLVHRDIAPSFLPALAKKLRDDRIAAGLVPVEFRVDPSAAPYIDGTPAGDGDFDTEFLDYILAVKAVDSAEEAVRHIAVHSTGHSEAIVTDNPETADFFVSHVDAAAVYVNASTRFTDGGEFGLGCEMGISTQKLGARGPMGLRELTSYKYVIRGNGQVRG